MSSRVRVLSAESSFPTVPDYYRPSRDSFSLISGPFADYSGSSRWKLNVLAKRSPAETKRDDRPRFKGPRFRAARPLQIKQSRGTFLINGSPREDFIFLRKSAKAR